MLLFHHAPTLGRRTLFFGVAVNPAFWDSASARHVLRGYRAINLIVGILAGVVAAAAAFTAVWKIRYGLRFGLVVGALLFHAIGATAGYVRAHRRVHAEVARTGLGPASPGDERHWIWGLFYFNPGDPSLQVEKRFGAGTTLNFARPLTWVLLAVPVLIGLALFALVRLVG